MEVPAAPKRIIICCDGSFQSAVSGTHSLPSNVTRLARCIAKAGRDTSGKVWQQVVYYDAGVGTGSLTTVDKIIQGATGDGLVINVIEAYNFVVNNYTPGDQVFCFGFSRGAYTARAVAGLINDLGVFKPENMQYFTHLFGLYQLNTAKHDFRKTKEYFQFVQGVVPLVPEDQADKPYMRKPHEIGHGELTWGDDSHEVEIVGVFDTVGSLGLGDTRLLNNSRSRQPYEYLNVKLSPYIKHAYHALALDERRAHFLPTLFYIPNSKTLEAEAASMAKDQEGWPELAEWRNKVDERNAEQSATHKPDLAQVWFSGVHINVGGGTGDEREDYEGLANITFAWMVEQCRPFLAFERRTFTDDGIGAYMQQVVDDGTYNSDSKETWTDTARNSISWMIEAGKTKLGWASAKQTRMVRAKNLTQSLPPTLGHYWAVSKNKDSYSLQYKLISNAVKRRPRESNDESVSVPHALEKLGETNEWIHPSVYWRTEKSKDYPDEAWHYQSNALVPDFTRTQDEYGAWGYAKGSLFIREWPIKATTPDTNAELLPLEFTGDGAEVREHLAKITSDWEKAERKTVERNKAVVV